MKTIKNKIFESIKKLNWKEYYDEYSDDPNLEKCKTKEDILKYIIDIMEKLNDQSGIESVYDNLSNMSNEMLLSVILKILNDNDNENKQILAGVLYYALTKDIKSSRDIADGINSLHSLAIILSPRQLATSTITCLLM